MKKLVLLSTMLMLAAFKSAAQEVTPQLTVFPEFRPATVYLSDGKKLDIPMANIFLKNSSLLYISGELTKEVDTKNLMRVDFKDRIYFRIDSVLAYQVDTIGANALFCAKVLDLKAYRQLIANNSNITNLDINDLTTMNMLQYTTIDINDVNDIHFPVIPLYYYRINDQFVLVHERNLKRFFNKENRRRMESVMNLPDFSWTDEKSLLKILEIIQQ
ncbi:MAG: hypothetical protein J6T44_02240 [Prevotella sp.]|nr:hypothetical protein [Prevotella sp.]MBO7538084.1 hypothetical protein [Prevotella sp.]